MKQIPLSLGQTLGHALSAWNDVKVLNAHFEKGRQDYLQGRGWNVPPDGDIHVKQWYRDGYAAAEAELAEAMG